jgi:histidinol-phosphatase (PHP family)
MQTFNCHVHTHNSPDSMASPEENSVQAKKAGLIGYAVTDHCDFPFPDADIMAQKLLLTAKETEEQRQKHTELKILTGIELAEAVWDKSYEHRFSTLYDWDILMGSVHAVRMKGHEEYFSIIDFSKVSDEFITQYLNQYFIDLEETAETADYDSLSHLTVPLRYIIHKYNRSVELSNWNENIDNILKSVIKRQKSLELNTSGYCGDKPYFMPDEKIIERYIKLGGHDFTIGSDAHIPTNMDCGLKEGVNLLKSHGINTLNYYEKRKKITYNID